MSSARDKSGNKEAKFSAARRAVELVGDGMTVGLGSGSTASIAIQLLGHRVSGGLKIRAVASSVKSATLASESGIEVIRPEDTDVIDIALDGADEVDKKGNLIKGGGASLLREKILAHASQRFYVMVDDSKLVAQLGQFPLPVEVVPFGANLTLSQIERLGCECHLRQEAGVLVVSDNGNYVADCTFREIADPAWLDVKLKMIPGVIETGLFLSQVVTSVIIGYRNGESVEVPVTP